ncbi:PH domain-containing protein [Tuwongella immobilis]|uniref:DUF304 domain-containing protein n=1 Tax=Tuwongella immobilis TaxID=692036 RepID=A0A6C2YVQ6_9BACT|nr:PH domain-containing protein [Tuwongella immobilis]VIP04952.1 unnamed protein product [Tuwongella immobilis]VTS07262.1 unnamed protein product [Tuwongella immobilis]
MADADTAHESVTLPFPRPRSSLPPLSESLSRPPARPQPVLDPAEEDLAWRGFSGWAMLPSFAICSLLSAAVIAAGWYAHQNDWLRIGVTHWMVVGTCSSIWAMQLFRWAYRSITVTVRLTPMHLFRDGGFLYPPQTPIPLANIQDVRTGGSLWDRMLGTGWVEIRSDAEAEPVRLEGIYRPGLFAQQIRQTIHEAEEQRIQSMRVPLSGGRIGGIGEFGSPIG